MNATMDDGVRATRLLLTTQFVRSIGQGALAVDFTLYLHALGWSAVSISALLSAALMIGVALTLFAGPLSDRGGRRLFSVCLRSCSDHCWRSCNYVRATLASLCCGVDRRFWPGWKWRGWPIRSGGAGLAGANRCTDPSWADLQPECCARISRQCCWCGSRRDAAELAGNNVRAAGLSAAISSIRCWITPLLCIDRQNAGHRGKAVPAWQCCEHNSWR